MLWASAGPLFAQKQFKYLPKALKAAPKTKIPYAVNPQLPPAVRAQFAMPLVRPNILPHVERAVAAQAIPPVQAQSPVTSATGTSNDSRVPAVPTPPTTAVEDTGTNLTGTQALAQYYPTWRQELGGMFSKEQLDAVEKAFAETDEWMFVRGEDGELKARNKDEWDYEARFLTLLQNSGVSFTDKQIKQLIGGKGTKGFTFGHYFTFKKTLAYVLDKGSLPRTDIKEGGKKITIAELNKRAEAGDSQAAELAREVALGKKIASKRWGNDPVHGDMQTLITNEAYLNQAVKKTPDEWLELIEAFVREHNRFPSQTTEEERQLYSGAKSAMRNNPNHPASIRMRELNEQYGANYASRKTPDEWLELIETFVREHNRWLSSSIEEEKQLYAGANHAMLNNPNHPASVRMQKLKKQYKGLHVSPKTPDEWLELIEAFVREHNRWPLQTIEEERQLYCGAYKAMCRQPNHPASVRMQELRKRYRRLAEAQTTQQLYTALATHIKDHGHYPMYKESSLPNIIHTRLYRYQSTMADGRYADPWLQKIYEIKQWSERVKRGEVDWEKFPGLFKKHRRTIGEMREQGILPSKEAAKELEQLPAEEQEAIEQMADNILTLWEDFEGVWWKQNHKHVITTPQTQTAFNTVLKTVQTQVPGASNINISNVLEQVNGMQLGQDGPDYYRVIYRGNNPRIPRAEDFHNVLETQGIPQDNAQAAYKLNSPHIVLDGDEETVYNLIIRQGVTDREISSIIDALPPAGWEIRLGAHELLNEIKQGFIHIHIEQVVPTTEEDAQDISNVLRVDVRALTQGKNPQQIAKTLRYLFSKYLKEDGHQALNNIQKAF